MSKKKKILTKKLKEIWEYLFNMFFYYLFVVWFCFYVFIVIFFFFFYTICLVMFSIYVLDNMNNRSI